MKTKEIQTEIFKELKLITGDKLHEIYDLIHYFRLGINSGKAEQITKPLGDKFAGVWLGDESARELIFFIKKNRVNRLKEIKF